MDLWEIETNSQVTVQLTSSTDRVLDLAANGSVLLSPINPDPWE